MKSMTGYGRGECSRNGFKVTVELSSVNRKQSEITVALPRELEVLEAQIRDLINRAIARGRLTARVVLHSADEAVSNQVRLNTKLARAYARELNRLAKELKLAGPLTLDGKIDEALTNRLLKDVGAHAVILHRGNGMVFMLDSPVAPQPR